MQKRISTSKLIAIYRSDFSKTYVIPALIGLLAAGFVVLIAPSIHNANEPDSNSISLNADSNLTSNLDSRIESNVGTPNPKSEQSPLVHSYSAAADKAIPAVVNIFTSKQTPRNQHPLFNDPAMQRMFPGLTEKRSQQSSLGSGVILNKNGYIITNHHVIAEADEIRVALSDGRETLALLVGSDSELDLALLKVNLTDLPTIEFANDMNLRIGDVVLAIGNPFGLGQTVTMGIISATGRKNMNLSSVTDFIQTDAAINQGNSGGALVNSRGQLVGINTAILSKSGENLGIGFAIPVSQAMKALNDISEYGQVVRGWLGVETRDLSQIHPRIKTQYGFPINLKGLLVIGVTPNGPIARAGINMGDVIVSLDNLVAEDPSAIRNRVMSLTPGETVTMEILRDGKLLKVRAKVGRK